MTDDPPTEARAEGGARGRGFARAFEHRDRLLSTALAELASEGYDKASINRILAAAGMSKGQFYHHFSSKEGLYLALVEHVLEQKRAHFEAHPLPDRSDFFATLEVQLRAGIAFSRAHPELDRFIRSVLRERGRPIFRTVTERFAFGGDSALAALVRRFHERGAFRRGLSAAFVERTVLLLFNHAAELVDLAPSDDLEAKLDQLGTFLRHGLGRTSDPR